MNEYQKKLRSLNFGGRIRIGGETQRDFEKRTDRELEAYRLARKEGIQPDGTTTKKVERAKRISDHLGVAYRGDDHMKTYREAGIIDKVTPIRRGNS